MLYLALLAVVWVGWTLRLYGLNWDQGYGLHPDERYITWVAASLYVPEKLGDFFHPTRTGLNPYSWPPSRDGLAQPKGQSPGDRSRSFSYGHFPLYLMVLAAGGDAEQARLALVGRVLSALFDTATILLTFALGRLLYGSKVGVLAAAFVALTVMHIQLAHFATFDTGLTCFVVATLLYAARFSRYGRRGDAILAGLFLGLAVGAKFSAVLLLLPLAVAHLLHWDRTAYGTSRSLRGSTSLLVLSLLVALFIFGLTNPFALIQRGEFLSNLQDQGAMLRGDDNFPFTRQYHGTWPYLYSVEQQMRWGMGFPLGLVAFGGLLLATIRAWRTFVRAETLILLSWALVYFGLVGSLYVKFMRYMLPVSPALAILGAGMVRLAARQVGRWRPMMRVSSGWRKGLGVGLGGTVILPTLLYAVAFLNVYRSDHPWLKLSNWIYTYIPVGATIAYEKWDHHLPLTVDLDGRVRWPGEYRQFALDPYVPDSTEKLRGMLKELAKSDYLIIASNRLYGSIAGWPARYPLMRRYYERLFDGQLGFRMVSLSNIERHPRLGPLVWLSDPFAAVGLTPPSAPGQERPAALTLEPGRADESFTVYDHPRPMLFKNASRLSSLEMERLFVDLFHR